MSCIFTIEWAVSQGLSITRPCEEWTHSRASDAPSRDGGTWTIRECERPHERMPSLSHIRQRASESSEDFFARLCESGEGDEFFCADEARSYVQASGALRDLDWLPTQD